MAVLEARMTSEILRVQKDLEAVAGKEQSLQELVSSLDSVEFRLHRALLFPLLQAPAHLFGLSLAMAGGLACGAGL